MIKKARTRITITLFIILCCIFTGFFFYTQLEMKEKSSKMDLYELVPYNTHSILETSNISNLFQTLETTVYQDACTQNQISDLFNFLNYRIDELAEEKGHGLSIPMSNVLISFHAPHKSKDQVLYGHLGNGDQSLMENILKELNTTGHSPKTIKYRGETITIYPVSNNDFLACFFLSNCYAISFQKKLIEEVIDTYKNNTSVKTDKMFSHIFIKQKNDNNIRLYARTNPIAEWAQYDIHILDDVIYLTGACYQKKYKKNSLIPLITEAKNPLFSAKLLPSNTTVFYQMGVQNIYSLAQRLNHNDSIKHKTTELCSEKDQSFYTFIEDYAAPEIDNVEFQGKDSTVNHRILLIPIKSDYQQTYNAWQDLAHPVKKWIQSPKKKYQLYTIENNRVLKYLLSKRVSNKEQMKAILTKKFIIISDEEEDLQAYVSKSSYSQEAYNAWNNYIGNLAMEANFTFFSDLDEIYKRPTEFRSVLPPFFFRHLGFFRHFTVTLQLFSAETPNKLNTNIILNYKREDINN